MAQANKLYQFDELTLYLKKFRARAIQLFVIPIFVGPIFEAFQDEHFGLGLDGLMGLVAGQRDEN
jgi:hypothetical protein